MQSLFEGKVTVGKVNRKEAEAHFLVCLNGFMKGVLNVCLCVMFTVPNERTPKNFLLTGHNLQWHGSKEKMALLCSYCTFSASYKVSPTLTSIAPL